MNPRCLSSFARWNGQGHKPGQAPLYCRRDAPTNYTHIHPGIRGKSALARGLAVIFRQVPGEDPICVDSPTEQASGKPTLGVLAS